MTKEIALLMVALKEIEDRIQVLESPNHTDKNILIEKFKDLQKAIKVGYQETQSLKQIYEALKKSAIVSVTDEMGVIVEVNRNFVKISGYSESELLGQSQRIVSSGKHPKSFFKNMWKTITSGHVWTGLIENQKKNGEYYWVHSVISPLFDLEAKIRNYVSIRFDVTEHVNLQKENQETQKKAMNSARLAALGEMSARIAHEINNPIHAIGGNAELILHFADKPEKVKSKALLIRQSVDRISKIIWGMQKFSRTEGLSNFTVNSLVDITKEVLAVAQISAKNNSINVTMSFSGEAKVNCSEIEIGQILINLFNNAVDSVKFMTEKWIDISIYEDDLSVFLRMSDSGKGIPKANQDKIFEPFFTTKEVGHGTGLGLSIVKGIVDKHGASIRLVTDSANTCFEICFPQA